MYETLIMLKPGESFTPAEMAAVVRDVSAMSDAHFESQTNSCVLRSGNSYLQIDYHSAPHIKEESEEIAEQFGLSCADCTTRYEMEGDDPDMLFFNDYLLINEKLVGTGKFIVFDSVEGKEFTA